MSRDTIITKLTGHSWIGLTKIDQISEMVEFVPEDQLPGLLLQMVQESY